MLQNSRWMIIILFYFDINVNHIAQPKLKLSCKNSVPPHKLDLSKGVSCWKRYFTLDTLALQSQHGSVSTQLGLLYTSTISVTCMSAHKPLSSNSKHVRKQARMCPIVFLLRYTSHFHDLSNLGCEKTSNSNVCSWAEFKIQHPKCGRKTYNVFKCV